MRRSGPFDSSLWLPMLFIGVVLVYLWPLTLQPLSIAYPPGSDFTDLLISHLPNAAYARQTLWEHGQWPLWNAQLFAGQPFAADPLASIWYPPAWLLLLPGLPLALGFNLLLLLHLAWGGLGLYRLLRTEGVGPGPALLGGLAFAGMPKLVAHLGAGHVSLVFAVAWTPWLLQAVRRAVAVPGWLRGALAGTVLAVIFLADVRWAFYAGLFAAGYGLWAWLGRGGEGPQMRVRLWLPAAAGFVVFAALLSAALALPLAEFVRHSSRAALTLDEAAVYSLPPVNTLGLLIRDVGGFHEYMTYAGTVTLLLAVIGLGRRTGFWWLAALLAGAFALGTNFFLFPFLFRLLPGLGLLRVPSRAWFLVALALCVLAGHGAHTLTQAWWPRLVQRYAKVSVRLPSARTALVVIGVVSVLDLARFNGTLLEARPMPALSPAAAWLREQPGQFRVYSPSYSLPPGDGLEHMDGVDPLQLATSLTFLEAATGVTAGGYSVTIPAFNGEVLATANRGAVLDTERLGLLNVRYIAAEFPIQAPRLALAQRFGSTWLYENEAWRPRAWMHAGGTAEVVAWSPNRIEVNAVGPGRLVLSEIAYPGWQVRVNGVAASLEIEQGLLRAVDLPPGPQSVVFTFQPASVYLGATLSALGLAALGILLRRARRTTW